MLLARLDRLPPDARRLAQEAAVIGARFDADAACGGCRRTGSRRRRPGAPLDAEIIEEVAGASSVAAQAYRFRQFLVQDVIYNNLLLEAGSTCMGVSARPSKAWSVRSRSDSRI